jgi:hypothetical protein
MKLNFIFSPEPLSRPVSLIEQKIGLTDAAILVPFESVPHTKERFCFENVRNVIADRGGEIVYGWLVWQHGNIFVEAEHHSVWRKTTGEPVCVTPQTPPEKAITFIPDPSATYDFDKQPFTNNIRIALVNDSRVEEFFKACEEQTEIMNVGRRNSGLGSTVELSDSEALRHTELEMKKIALMSQVLPSDSRQSRVEKVGRNEPCPCGSGKKYKKCHGS